MYQALGLYGDYQVRYYQKPKVLPARYISLGEKPTGQPSAPVCHRQGNPHAGLDAAGAGNVAMGAGLRPTTKGVEKPPDPNVCAPVLDPTGSGGGVGDRPADHNAPDAAIAARNRRPHALVVVREAEALSRAPPRG